MKKFFLPVMITAVILGGFGFISSKTPVVKTAINSDPGGGGLKFRKTEVAYDPGGGGLKTLKPAEPNYNIQSDPGGGGL
ncbi:hypothetical protein IHV10_22235 [Fictibacillus sp. 5RED26]|uniref:hypothetical protein n=1 Tax=Fictibacillus sp. 5RED26 TaxID=2745876 RepID=UPI0018CF185C|nr:hypothetical protein [Fictibacillus sp. 5RED26]MBH0159092.1 hypothetical protein [Fictibacillus sp. 5RED26]